MLPMVHTVAWTDTGYTTFNAFFLAGYTASLLSRELIRKAAQWTDPHNSRHILPKASGLNLKENARLARKF